MIIVNLKGGLGNQMFQYAAGKALATKTQQELKIDITSLTRANEIGNIYRPFSLDRFTLSAPLATDSEIQKLKPAQNILTKVYRKIVYKLQGDRTVCFDEAFMQLTGEQYLEGYWQSPRYFENIREDILCEFALKESDSSYNEQSKNKMQQGDSVSMHIRRGDYIKNPTVAKEFGQCSTEYYQKAIAHVTKHTTNPRFFIFSDDIEWVKENLQLPTSTVFVSDPSLTDTEELVLMSKCAHHIIANSSFSWWAAWLNQNPAKIVIAPTPWFDNLRYDAHLIPDTWTLLPKQ